MPAPTLAEVTVFVAEIYQRLLGRAPEAAVAPDVLRRGITATVVEAEIAASAEAKAYAASKVPPVPPPVPVVPDATITALTSSVVDLKVRVAAVEKQLAAIKAAI